MMVLVIGVIGVGIAKRCEWLGMCDGAVVAAPPPATETATPPTVTTASDSDNGKKKKCGCCNCKQNSVKEIVCDTGVGSTTFTNGLTLAAQCDACAKDPNICKNAKEAQRQADTQQAIKDANENVTGKTVPGLGVKVSCGSGYHLTDKNVCVKNSSKSNPKPNSSGDSPGCKSGETFTNCHTVNGKLQCTCARYTRVMSGYTNNYNINKFARVAI